MRAFSAGLSAEIQKRKTAAKEKQKKNEYHQGGFFLYEFGFTI